MTTHLLLCASITACALGLAAQPASAETPTNPWYVGVSTGVTNISVYDPSVFDGGSKDGPDHSSWSLQVGFRASNRFAVELTRLNAGNLSWEGQLGAQYSDSRFDVEATEVSAVGIFSAGPICEFRSRLGVARYDLAGTQTLEGAYSSYWSPALVSSEAVVESRHGFLIGASIGANLTPHWSVWLDYQSLFIDSSFLGSWAQYEDSTIDTYSLAATYRFGGDRDSPAGP